MKPETALAEMRRLCLSWPDTREGEHFGSTGFYVGKKLFATCGAKHGVVEIIFGLEPDHAEALVAHDPRFKPYPKDKRAVVVDAAAVKKWNELTPLIRESYELSKPRKAVKGPAAQRARPRR